MCRTVLLAAAVWGVCVLSAPTPARADDMQTVSDRVAANILSSVWGQTTISNLASQVQADGRWADIDYADQNTSLWKPANHTSRLRELTKAYVSPSHPLYHNADLQAAIFRAYDYWTGANLVAANWWFNDIDTPNKMSEVMLLLQRDGNLSAARLTAGNTQVLKSYQPRTVNSGTNTGQNRVWRSNATRNRGILNNDGALVTEAFASVGDTVARPLAEGIQVDNSFHQHSVQLYSAGSYGIQFGTDVSRIAAEGAGTTYAMPADKQRIFVDYLLDGQQWFTRGDAADLTAAGRDIGRPDPKDRALQLVTPASRALTFGTYRQAELQAMYNRLNTARTTHTADPATALSGNRSFWTSDIMVHQRPGYYTSAKTNSSRTRQPELVNNENIKGLHVYDGVNLLYRTGNEHDGIQPVWDWYRLPGTTTERGTYSLVPSNVYGSMAYAGGVSDGTYGASATKMSKRNVNGKKAWFFFDNEYVALGADIDAPAAGAANIVGTNINQTLLNGAVTYKTSAGTQQTLANGASATPAQLKWVHHDSVGYLFPSPLSSATLQAKTQTGNWSSLATAFTTYADSSLDVFSLDVSHGTRPNNATYAYIVVPNVTTTQLEAYAGASPISILRNDATVQAVHHQTLGITQAAFYGPATLDILPGYTLTQVNTGVGSMVMLRRVGDDVIVSASSPEALSMTLQLRVTMELAGTGAVWSEADGYTTLSLALPSGEYAGSSVTRTFTVVPEPAALAALGTLTVLLTVRIPRRR